MFKTCSLNLWIYYISIQNSIDETKLSNTLMIYAAKKYSSQATWSTHNMYTDPASIVDTSLKVSTEISAKIANQSKPYCTKAGYSCNHKLKIDLTDICRKTLSWKTKALYLTFKDLTTKDKISYVKFHGIRDPEKALRP